MKKWRCQVCGFIHDGIEPPEQCPKCGAPREKFEAISDDAAAMIQKARYTNQLHMDLSHLMEQAKEICRKGIEDQLDPPCVQLFEKAAAEAHKIQQMIKAELQGHMNKGKWG
ncbi:MAG: rubredoxin-like domain-containing protein [Bacillota bacterium]